MTEILTGRRNGPCPHFDLVVAVVVIILRVAPPTLTLQDVARED